MIPKSNYSWSAKPTEGVNSGYKCIGNKYTNTSMPQPKLSGHILGGCYTFPEESKDVPDKWVEIYIHDLLSPGNLLRNHLVSKLYMEVRHPWLRLSLHLSGQDSPT